MAPRNKGSRISTLTTRQDEEVSNHATLTIDVVAIIAEMMNRMEEQKNQANTAIEAMKKQFEEQIQAVRKENLMLRAQAQVTLLRPYKGKRVE